MPVNEVAPIFLTGVFLPRVDLSASWSYAPGGGTAFIPTLEKNTAEQIERNIKTFELECCLKNIKHRVHKYPYDGALSELGKETRFTDLLILDSSTFFNETGQEFSNKRTILLHLTSKKNAVIPDLSFIEELVARHFTDLTIQALKAMPGKHFETWLGTIRAPMLVCGSFARPELSQLFRKSFANNILNDHKIPVFLHTTDQLTIPCYLSDYFKYYEMKNSLKLLTIKHTSIYLHWSFGLLVVLILFVQSARGTAVSEVWWSALSIATVFICVVLHELGHSFVAERYGIHTKSITLLPIGGIASMEKLPEKPVPEIIVSAAGPAVNLLIALVLFPFVSGYPPFWKAAELIESLNGSNFLYYLYVINVMLALFNLIPAFPMDGGRILKGMLELKLDITRTTDIAAITGRLIATLFIIGGLITFDVILMLIGLFIIISSTGEEKLIYLKAAAKGFHLKDLAENTYCSFPANMTIAEAAERMLFHQDNYFLVMEDAAVVGAIERNTILGALSTGKHERKIRQFMTANVPALNKETPLEEVIDKLSGSKVVAIPVISDNRIVGAVNLQNIIEYLVVHDINLKEHHGNSAIYRFLILLSRLCPDAITPGVPGFLPVQR